MKAERFAFIADLYSGGRRVRAWTFGKPKRVFGAVGHLPDCDSRDGIWGANGYRVVVWLRGSIGHGIWTVDDDGFTDRPYDRHPKKAWEILEEGLHLD